MIQTKDMTHEKEKWYRRKHVGVTEKSNPLFPVYFQHVCDAKFPGGTVIAKCLSRDKEVLKANAKKIRAVMEILEALKGVFELIENGTLVRDTSKDNDTNEFLKQGAEINNKIFAAKQAIKNAE